MIKITFNQRIIEGCTSAILVPQRAIEEPGYIQTFTSRNDSSSKHEFHAMAQMAYFQFQDDELEILQVSGDIIIENEGSSEAISLGMILYRKEDGSFEVGIHENVNIKKILEATYRFCTRWVRLDI